MKKIIFCLFFIFMSCGLVYADSCTDCHGTAAGGGANHEDWAGSVHEKSKVSCYRCHGGYPAKKEKEAAHKGIRPADNKQSKLHFEKIPDTCGNCHIKEHRQFSKSDHYLHVKSSDKAPDCVTCHGPLGNRQMQPEEIETRCMNCHVERLRINPAVPGNIKNSVMLMNAAKTVLKFARWLIEGTEEVAASVQLDNARALISGTAEAWHSLDMDILKNTFNDSIYKASGIALAAIEAIKAPPLPVPSVPPATTPSPAPSPAPPAPEPEKPEDRESPGEAKSGSPAAEKTVVEAKQETEPKPEQKEDAGQKPEGIPEPAVSVSAGEKVEPEAPAVEAKPVEQVSPTGEEIRPAVSTPPAEESKTE